MEMAALQVSGTSSQGNCYCTLRIRMLLMNLLLNYGHVLFILKDVLGQSKILFRRRGCGSQFQALPSMASLQSLNVIAFSGLYDGSSQQRVIIILKGGVLHPGLDCC